MYQSDQEGNFVFDVTLSERIRRPVNILLPNNSVCVLFSSFMS